MTIKVSNNKGNRICDLLKNHCSKEWNELLDLHRTISTYSTGVEIFSEGQDANALQIIETGRAKVFSRLDGKERIVRLAGDGDIIGHRGFGGDNTYSVSAVALSPVTLKNIPRKIFDKILKANPEFCFHFMMFFAEELRTSEEQIKNSINSQVLNRVAKSLILNISVFGLKSEIDHTLNFTLSRKDIASLSFTTYESVIRVLSTLDKENVIEIVGREIKIIDIPRLHSLAVI